MPNFREQARYSTDPRWAAWLLTLADKEDPAMSPLPVYATAALAIGQTVRHPARGVGTVATLVHNPITGRPMKAWVEFQFIGTSTRRFLCFADDLTVVPKPVASGERPTLSVVEQPAGAA
jgi:hypothetical protein